MFNLTIKFESRKIKIKRKKKAASGDSASSGCKINDHSSQAARPCTWNTVCEWFKHTKMSARVLNVLPELADIEDESDRRQSNSRRVHKAGRE